MPVHLVTLPFDTERVAPALIEQVGTEATLAGFMRRVVGEERWSWARTGSDALLFSAAPHLLQRVDTEHPYRVLARYLFDGVHAAAHPELLDPEHIGILHGTMAAKLLDEGLIVLEPDGIAASLRWVGTERPGVRLSRDGGRIKRHDAG